MPECMSMCGELMAPAARMTSLRARTTLHCRFLVISTAVAVMVCGSMRTRVTRLLRAMCRLGLFLWGTTPSPVTQSANENTTQDETRN